jgi:hypothetical protein
VGKRINDFRPNLRFSPIGPPLISEAKHALLSGIVCLVESVTLITDSVFLQSGPVFFNDSAVDIVTVFVELVVCNDNVPWPNVPRLQTVQSGLVFIQSAASPASMFFEGLAARKDMEPFHDVSGGTAITVSESDDPMITLGCTARSVVAESLCAYDIKARPHPSEANRSLATLSMHCTC